ncbi:DUF7144 family membrane protein [Microbacterium deminutum]|uniref:DUF7144 domain-containing protein n=1 Tax=Microbacterium deminutum TaxID=344164 RepID=A0ABP5C9M1_9MICO
MTDTNVTGWTGWGVFASVLLLIAGIFDLIFGLAAVIGPNSTLVVTEHGLFAVDVAAWGWWHILSGVLLIIVSFSLYRGMTWARVVAIILVILNAIGQLTLFSQQPWLSLIILAVDILIIYALTVHGHELKAKHGN